MRVFLLPLACILLAGMALAAPSDRAEADRLFALGTSLHAEGDLRGAVAAYEGALATGWASVPLHLNLASAYLGAGDPGRARLHAERAARYAPSDPRVGGILELVRETVGEEPARPPNAAEAVVRWARLHLGGGTLAALALGGWVLLMGLAAVRLWTRRSSPWLRRGTIVLAPLVAAALVLAVVVSHAESRPRGVVVAPEAVIRASPSADASALATLPAGHLLPLGAGRGLWQAVLLPDGTPGWAEAAMLEEV